MNIRKLMVGLILVLGVQFFAEAGSVSNQQRKERKEIILKIAQQVNAQRNTQKVNQQPKNYGASFFDNSKKNGSWSTTVKSLQNFMQSRRQSLHNFVGENAVTLVTIAKKFKGPVEAVFNGAAAIGATLVAVLLI